MKFGHFKREKLTQKFPPPAHVSLYCRMKYFIIVNIFIILKKALSKTAYKIKVQRKYEKYVICVMLSTPQINFIWVFVFLDPRPSAPKILQEEIYE